MKINFNSLTAVLISIEGRRLYVEYDRDVFFWTIRRIHMFFVNNAFSRQIQLPQWSDEGNDTCRFSLYFHIALKRSTHNHRRIFRGADFSKNWIERNYRAWTEVTRVATFAQTFPQALQTSHVGWHKRDADFSVISGDVGPSVLFDTLAPKTPRRFSLSISLLPFSVSILAANSTSRTKPEKMLSSLDDTRIFGETSYS